MKVLTVNRSVNSRADSVNVAKNTEHHELPYFLGGVPAIELLDQILENKFCVKVPDFLSVSRALSAFSCIMTSVVIFVRLCNQLKGFLSALAHRIDKADFKQGVVNLLSDESTFDFLLNDIRLLLDPPYQH